MTGYPATLFRISPATCMYRTASVVIAALFLVTLTPAAFASGRHNVTLTVAPDGELSVIEEIVFTNEWASGRELEFEIWNRVAIKTLPLDGVVRAPVRVSVATLNNEPVTPVYETEQALNDYRGRENLNIRFDLSSIRSNQGNNVFVVEFDAGQRAFSRDGVTTLHWDALSVTGGPDEVTRSISVKVPTRAGISRVAPVTHQGKPQTTPLNAWEISWQGDQATLVQQGPYSYRTALGYIAVEWPEPVEFVLTRDVFVHYASFWLAYMGGLLIVAILWVWSRLAPPDHRASRVSEQTHPPDISPSGAHYLWNLEHLQFNPRGIALNLAAGLAALQGRKLMRDGNQYILTRYYVAVLLGLVLKKLVAIERVDETHPDYDGWVTYRFSRTDAAATEEPAGEEAEVLGKLFEEKSSVCLDPGDAGHHMAARYLLWGRMHRFYGNEYMSRAYLPLAFGALATLLLAVALIWQRGIFLPVFPPAVFLAAIAWLATFTWQFFKRRLEQPEMPPWRVVLAIVLIAPLPLYLLGPIPIDADLLASPFYPLFAGLGFAVSVFYWTMRRWTALGAPFIDQLEGYRQWLATNPAADDPVHASYAYALHVVDGYEHTLGFELEKIFGNFVDHGSNSIAAGVLRAVEFRAPREFTRMD